MTLTIQSVRVTHQRPSVLIELREPGVDDEGDSIRAPRVLRRAARFSW